MAVPATSDAGPRPGRFARIAPVAGVVVCVVAAVVLIACGLRLGQDRHAVSRAAASHFGVERVRVDPRSGQLTWTASDGARCSAAWDGPADAPTFTKAECR